VSVSRTHIRWGLIVALAAAAAWYAVSFLPLPGYARSTYARVGKFGPVGQWPLTPIHAVALPDGRVLTFGTDAHGQQGGVLIYDIWNPAKGWGASSHLTLPNATGTNIFCAGTLVLPDAKGTVLLAGGDRTVNGQRNWSAPEVTFFDPGSNTLRDYGKPMRRPRWYPTVLTLPSGDVIVAGGRVAPKLFTGDVEVYHPDGSWGQLEEATSDAAFGASNWNYPRMWLLPDDKVFVLSVTGDMFRMDMKQGGKVSHLDVPAAEAGSGHAYLPSVMYRPGHILAMRSHFTYKDIDVTGARPVVRPVAHHYVARQNSNLTLMADGTVLLSGGALRDNSENWFVVANRVTEIWNPDTGEWRFGPIANKPRMYHSVAMLMPDGTVFTGGGGAPGPVENLNAEIYYPPYLFKKDGSGEFAPRPTIVHAPAVVDRGQTISVGVNAPEGVGSVTLLHSGAVTHTVGFEQGFHKLTWQQTREGELQVELPSAPNELPPGYYYLFVFDKAGVPSVSKMIRVAIG